MHGSLQTQQQVRQPGLSGSRQARVQAAALLPQVQFAGFGQGVTDSVVLRDELLTDCQSVTALRKNKGDSVLGATSQDARGGPASLINAMPKVNALQRITCFLTKSVIKSFRAVFVTFSDMASSNL